MVRAVKRSLMPGANRIRPADLTAPHHKSGDSPRDLYRTVATGLNGTPMAGFAGQLREEEIWELVARMKW